MLHGCPQEPGAPSQRHTVCSCCCVAPCARRPDANESLSYIAFFTLVLPPNWMVSHKEIKYLKTSIWKRKSAFIKMTSSFWTDAFKYSSVIHPYRYKIIIWRKIVNKTDISPSVNLIHNITLSKSNYVCLMTDVQFNGIVHVEKWIQKSDARNSLHTSLFSAGQLPNRWWQWARTDAELQPLLQDPNQQSAGHRHALWTLNPDPKSAQRLQTQTPPGTHVAAALLYPALHISAHTLNICFILQYMIKWFFKSEPLRAQ